MGWDGSERWGWGRGWDGMVQMEDGKEEGRRFGGVGK